MYVNREYEKKEIQIPPSSFCVKRIGCDTPIECVKYIGVKDNGTEIL